MIVNTGAILLLTDQQAEFSACYFCLFTDNETIVAGTVWSDLTEAAWTGYARVACGSLNTPTIISGRASMTPVVNPAFTNGSGSTVTPYGWALIDTVSGTVLVAAVNLGATSIPAGQGLTLVPTITLKQE